MDLLDTRPKGEIKDFIYVKDGSLTEFFCKYIIDKFDKDPRQKDGVLGSGGKRVDKSIKIEIQTLDNKKITKSLRYNT